MKLYFSPGACSLSPHTERARLVASMARVAARPAVQAAMKAKA